jgi:predicted nucleotidyltransferase
MKRNAPLTGLRIRQTLKKRKDLLDKYSVKRIGLFGSYATRSATRKSDIDFLVEFEHPTYDNFSGLIRELEKLFGRKVEVLTPDAVDSIRVDEVARSIRESVVYV